MRSADPSETHTGTPEFHTQRAHINRVNLRICFMGLVAVHKEKFVRFV
jgi:hypothetical protein